MGFLPVKISETNGQLDFILITADAYIDHPSFGHAIISRVLEYNGYTVGIISQPNWKDINAFKILGKPRYAFLVSGGNIDSMVNNYSVTKNKRKVDAYTPGGKIGKRPDRPVIVYSNMVKKAYADTTVIVGGIEASLRRFSHYDYWNDLVMPSVLVDSGADILMYGMGERAIVEIADSMRDGVEKLVNGCCYIKDDISNVGECIIIPSYEQTKKNMNQYNLAFKLRYEQQNSPKSPVIVQPHGIRYVVQMPASKPLSTYEMDEVYSLPYMRKPHPMYKEPIPAIEEIEYSITAHRGCYGGCSFCALIFHQGRIIQHRSIDSIVEEAKLLAKDKGFKGYIHDVGGPTANFHTAPCKKQEYGDICKHRQCMFPTPCPNLNVDHSEWIDSLKKVSEVEGVKKVFVRSGIRFDYLLREKDKNVLDYLVDNHISGQLKIAPEHISDNVLRYMGKPCSSEYKTFCRKYNESNKKLGKNQYIVPYFMSSHPGCDLKDAVELAVYLKENDIKPKQVQDFYPTPDTLATCMYYTGKNPLTGEKVFVAKSPEQKAMQRALMQYFLPQNAKIIEKALKICKREDLIGFDKKCLIWPQKDSNKNNEDKNFKNNNLKRVNKNNKKSSNNKLRYK